MQLTAYICTLLYLPLYLSKEGLHYCLRPIVALEPVGKRVFELTNFFCRLLSLLGSGGFRFTCSCHSLHTPRHVGHQRGSPLPHTLMGDHSPTHSWVTTPPHTHGWPLPHTLMGDHSPMPVLKGGERLSLGQLCFVEGFTNSGCYDCRESQGGQAEERQAEGQAQIPPTTEGQTGLV